ncbi:MAG: hypothetical protein HS108_10560 [Planctomycetes bacterium]|jgi:hypothetical protein|nr:hypothetical protein [Planctomycetota bacterium]MCL4728997.1 hypothetical protein [Planctomycetota bacterium]
MKSLFAVVLAICGGALSAQLSISTVIHEPSPADAGTYLANQTVPNPDYNPLQPNGQPQNLPLIGNGKGIHNELDSVSDEFYAIAATTTHDLAILTNNSGADITVDPTSLQIAQIRPKVTVPQAPEQANPGILVAYPPDPFSNTNYTIANGASSVLCLVRTKWKSSLDTSPRDYIITIQFNNVATGGGPVTIDAPLWVPEVGGGKSGGGCTTAHRDLPGGVALLAGGGLVAILTRRKRLLRRV